MSKFLLIIEHAITLTQPIWVLSVYSDEKPLSVLLIAFAYVWDRCTKFDDAHISNVSISFSNIKFIIRDVIAR